MIIADIGLSIKKEIQLNKRYLLDGKLVRVLWVGKYSAEVERLDGGALIYDAGFGLIGTDTRGHVNLERLEEVAEEEGEDEAEEARRSLGVEEQCEECPWDHDPAQCAVCIERGLGAR